MTTSCSCKTWFKAIGLVLFVVAIIGRGLGALFLIGAVIFFGYPKAFVVLGAGDFLFSVFHLYYLSGAEGGNPFRHYLD